MSCVRSANPVAIGTADPNRFVPFDTRTLAAVRRPDWGLLSIERLTEPEHTGVVDELLREYLPWVAHQAFALFDMPLEELPALVQRHHGSFRDKMPRLLERPGRLLLARLDGTPAGMVALEPADARTAVVKRLYLRPAARGQGVGRALLERLLADARDEGFQTARLETLNFMTEALPLYRSLGFVERAAFDDSQVDTPAPPGLVRFMELPLHAAA